MTNNHHAKIHRINCLSGDLNALYHQAALKLGISDSAMFVLYMLHYKGDGCLLYDICQESGISKQTINSTLRKLEADGVLYLENDKGRTKCVCLTDTGKEYVSQTGARLFDAECRTFDDWTEDEIDQYLNLMEKYNRSFGSQIEKM